MIGRLNCAHCGGEGRIFKSRYGGNDPDVWDAGECPACKGTANQPCEARGCTSAAIGFNDDGDAMCEDCLVEWASEYNGGRDA